MTQTQTQPQTDKKTETAMQTVMQAVNDKIAQSEERVAAHLAAREALLREELAEELKDVILAPPSVGLPKLERAEPAKSLKTLLGQKLEAKKVIYTRAEQLARVPAIAAQMAENCSDDPATQEVFETALTGFLAAGVQHAHDLGLVEAPKKPMSTAMKVGLAVGGTVVAAGIGYGAYRVYKARQEPEALEEPTTDVIDAELVG